MLLSLAGMGTGFMVVYGILTWKWLDSWTAIFPGHHRFNEPDRTPLFRRAYCPIARGRCHVARRAGGCDPLRLRSSAGRRLTTGLCGLRRAAFLFELLVAVAVGRT